MSLILVFLQTLLLGRSVPVPDFATQCLKELGFEVEHVQTPIHPVILATRGDPSWPGIVIYGHYDVQPPDPLDLWSSDPFQAVERDGRLYGRELRIIRAHRLSIWLLLARALKKKNPDLPLRITYLIEGEEEIGSPSFRPFLEERKDSLRGDFLLVSDTGSPGPHQLAVTTGCAVWLPWRLKSLDRSKIFTPEFMGELWYSTPAGTGSGMCSCMMSMAG